MASGLNAPQLQASEHRDGPLLVFAGAGSGKTRVITQRIGNLVAGGVDPSKVCAVTFTNKAAGEMRERLAGMLGEDVARRISISTFHALCVRLLRQPDALEFSGRKRGFVIYDERDSKEMIAAIMADVYGDEENEDGDAHDRKTLMEEFDEFLERRNQALDMPESYVAGEFERDFVEIWKRFERAKRTSNAFDFGDLIVWGTRLVEHGEVGARFRRLFDYLLIDEFQDTDGVQLRFVKALAHNGNLCVVGDDDQCIYAWRGAEVENIRGFRAHYPDVTVVKLEQNYRSSANVVSAAVHVIERAFNREPKRMFTETEPGDPVKVVSCRDDTHEAQAIVAEAHFLAAQGVPWGSMAVLYRSHTTARAIEKELRAASIAYKTHGGFRWFDRAEIRAAISLFKTALNASSNVDCIRAMLATQKGVGPVTVAKVLTAAEKHSLSFFTTLRRKDLLKVAGVTSTHGIESFVSTILSVASEADTAGCATITKRILEDSRYIEQQREAAKKCLTVGGKEVAPEKLDVKTRAKYDAAMQRAERLDELVADAQRFEERARMRGDKATFADYVEAICLRADDREEDSRGVQLMTVHASKGLEFDTVFIPASEQEAFARGVNAVIEEDDEDEEPAGDKDALDAKKSLHEAEDDARRLFYVALTRAKKRLYLLHAMYRFSKGRAVPRTKCDFIWNIPEEVRVEVDGDYLIERGRAAMEAMAEDKETESW